MRTSAMHEAITSVVRLLRARSALDGVCIVDGPPFEWNPLRVPKETGDGRQYLFVGADPDGEDGDAATGEQNWAGTGLPRDKDERFVIRSVGLVMDGGQDIESYRGELFDNIHQVEQMLLERIDLSPDGIAPGPVLYSGFAGVERLRQFYSDQGCTVSAQFNIGCRAYLTS